MSPTVLRRNGFRVEIYQMDDRAQGEHLPQHVHVIRSGMEVVVNLEPVSIREVGGMRRADIRAAVRLVEDERDFLLAEWIRING